MQAGPGMRYNFEKMHVVTCSAADRMRWSVTRDAISCVIITSLVPLVLVSPQHAPRL